MKRQYRHAMAIAGIILMIISIMPSLIFGANEELQVDDTKTPEELVQMFLGSGMEIRNVSYTGHEKARGTFRGGEKIIGFEEGIVLSTGRAKNIVGPNKDHGISADFLLPGDEDLSNLIDGVKTRDAAVLEFDFIPETDDITFTYVFASEEYNEYVNEYNDVFAFFINGENRALIPGTDTPVSINNVNGGKPLGNNPMNAQFFRNNERNKKGNGASVNIEMDGLTTVMEVRAKVKPHAINHIKLAIADARDCSLDSAVLLKAGSFVSQEALPPTDSLPEGTIIGRMPGYIKLGEPEKIPNPGGVLSLSYDTKILGKNPNHTPRVYYWNGDKENWVALTTYQEGKGVVKAINDGGYAGWFTVLGVIEPAFKDEGKSRNPDLINRMNGLGIVEGYYEDGPWLSRSIMAEETVSRGEFLLFIYRILNIDIHDPKLPPLLPRDAQSILEGFFDDCDEIPEWLLIEAGTLCETELLSWQGGNFGAASPITRQEAAIMVCNALAYLGHESDHPDPSLRPMEPLTREEALSFIYDLFIKGLGW